MEDEKKRKRNKKKKNRQQNNNNSNNNEVTAGISTSIDPQKDHVSANGLIGQVPESTDAETDVMQNVDRDLVPNDRELAEADKQYWLDRDASLQEKIRLLQEEKNVLFENEATLRAKVENLLKQIIEKEANLEERLKQSKSEKDAYEEKEATLQEKLVLLQKEREAHLQKEASLKENVRQMQKEKETLMQEKDELEMKVEQLKSEKQSWLQKEVAFEEKINQLVNEAVTLSLKGVSLEEKIKQMETKSEFWVQNGNFEETFPNLDRENTKLRAEVMDLKEQWNCLLRENQLLKESMSALQSHIEDLEKTASLPSSSSERQIDTFNNGDHNSGIDAAHMLIKKLIAENAELCEKVNALSIGIASRGLTAEASSVVDSHPKSGVAECAHVAESSIATSKQVFYAATTQEIGQDPAPMLDSDLRMPPPGRGLQSMENVMIKDEQIHGDYLTAGNNMSLSNSSEIDKSGKIMQIPLDEEIDESGKIMQIPLDENEIQVVNSGATHDEERPDVPLTDAPLIGAPFRLIGFVARYVSGADLINKSSAN